MTTRIFFSGNPLGEITEEQLQRMLDRFQLGNLLSYEKTAKGAGNQTLFITAESGVYVFKGNPLYEDQLAEEKYYVEGLSQRTSLPLPEPFLVDESKDIFGWSYAIMPRLSGTHMNDPDLQASLGREDNEQMAKVLAAALCDMHVWKVEEYGEWDPVHRVITPFQDGYTEWLFNRIRYWLDDAKKYSSITSADEAWVENLLASAKPAFESHDSPSYVMGDFKADNVLFQHREEGWRISGIFDFTNGYFGDGVADLAKFTSMYIRKGEAELARKFIRAYFRQANDSEGWPERLKIHMLHQCVLDWGCAKAIGQVTWDAELSFAAWAAEYTGVIERLNV